MNDTFHRFIDKAALMGVHYAVFSLVGGGVVLPTNNGPVFAADTRTPSNYIGLSKIQGCH